MVLFGSSSATYKSCNDKAVWSIPVNTSANSSVSSGCNDSDEVGLSSLLNKPEDDDYNQKGEEQRWDEKKEKKKKKKRVMSKDLTGIKSKVFAFGSITKDCICATCESSRISNSDNAARYEELLSLLDCK